MAAPTSLRRNYFPTRWQRLAFQNSRRRKVIGSKLKTSFLDHCRRRPKDEPRRLRRLKRWAVQGSFVMSYLWHLQSRSTTKHWHWLPSFAKRGLTLRYRPGFIRKRISLSSGRSFATAKKSTPKRSESSWAARRRWSWGNDDPNRCLVA